MRDESQATLRADRLPTRPTMKRFISRLCCCEETDFVLQVVAPSLTLGGAIVLAIGVAIGNA